MKAVGNIYLVWRKGPGSRRIPIGVIKKNVSEGVRFAYIKENVEKAKAQGFDNYEGFPDINKEYSENVLDIFGQRIVRSERRDLEDYYKFWQINKEHLSSDYYMLANTQGLLPTDNFEFLADFYPVSGLSFVSEISGLSHNEISSDALYIGDELRYELEKQNPHDEYAVKLFKGELFLGYVKTVHSRVFSKMNARGLKVKVHHIEKNGVLKRVFIKVYKD